MAFQKRFTISILSVVLLLSSCAVSYAPFTEQMLSEFKLDTKNIKNVQFFISDEITLYQLKGPQAVGKEAGTFVKSEQRISEKVVIKAKTPCVVEKIDKEGFFYVRFESGKDKVLKFKKADNFRYYLHTEIKDKRYVVTYAEQEYIVTSPSLTGFLMVTVEEKKEDLYQRSLMGQKAR
jgi:hypothetical protein